MACTGIGPYTWYLYNESWNLINCVDTSSADYNFTGINTAGTYNVLIVSNGYSATTQFVVTGNESCCWDSKIYQPCDEGCQTNGDGISIVKGGEDFQFSINNTSGAMELFFKKLNDSLGFNSTYNLNSRPYDVSVLYSSDSQKGLNVYFQGLLRSYECCSAEPGSEILFTSPCINEPTYKVLQFCNTCDVDNWVSGYSFNESFCTYCPDGYTLDPDGVTCSKMLITGATAPQQNIVATSAGTSAAWCWNGARFYPSLNTLSTPLINNGTDATNTIKDNLSNIVHPNTVVYSDFWGRNPNALFHGRMNNGAAIWTDSHPQDLWIGFSACLYLNESKTYYLGIGGDNEVKISINGTEYVNLSDNNTGNFQAWHVFPILLNSGNNYITLEGLDTGSAAGFGAEIYSANTLSELTAATTTNEAGLVWSTKDLYGVNFDIAGSSGYTCPSGYMYTNCPTPSCNQISRVNSSGSTLCLDNWDIKFMSYSGDCETRHLVEFDPYSHPKSFNNNCDSVLYPYPECKCFYVAIGYRGEDINDRYTTFNIFLTDNTSSGLKTISYDLHGRSSINFPTTEPVSTIGLLSTPISSTIESNCPIKPSCDCLTVVSNDNTDDNGGYPVGVSGVPVYQFNKTYTITNKCYVEFNLDYLYTYPTYTGLTIDTSDFSGVLGKNKTSTLNLSYYSTEQTNVIGVISYSASTYDPFLCQNNTINCSDLLTFIFDAKPIPLTITSLPYSFGRVGNGCCGNATFTLQNTGDVQISINNLSLTNTFFQITDPITPLESQLILSPGNTLLLKVNFCPTGCTDGTTHTTDLIISTAEYGDILGSSLSSGFGVSGVCTSPSISASTNSLVFIKKINEQPSETLTICNKTDVDQNVGISNCVDFVSGTTQESIDPLNYGFDIVVGTEQTLQNTITYPRTLTIPSNNCTDVDIRYDILQADKKFCSLYLRDNCGNVTEIPFTGYSLPYPIEVTSISYTNPTCFGNTNGSVTISYSGGSLPYDYVFSGSNVYRSGTLATTTLTFDNLGAEQIGTDYIFYLSGNPCNGSMSVPDLSPFINSSSPEVLLSSPVITTLYQPPYFEIIETNYTGKTCIELASASVKVTGGTTPYIFTWSNGITQTGGTTPYTTILTGLQTGTYGVTVNDFNGCQIYNNVTIPTLLPLSVATQTTAVSCYGGSNGSAFVNLYNAVNPVTYYWSGLTYNGYSVYPSHTDSYTSTTSNTLTAGTYYLSYIDGNGCSGHANINVVQPNILGFYCTGTNVTCPNLTDGIITFNTVSGGTYPYIVYASGETTSYSSTTQTISNVDSGYYNTYVIDYHGCITPSFPVIITKPDPITFIYNYTATTCFSSTDGGISLTVTGGTPPYSYFWTPSIGSTNYVNGLSRGYYGVSIFDNNGCSLTTGFTLPYNLTYCGDLTVINGDGNEITKVGGVYPINMKHTCLNTTSENIIQLCQSSPCPFTILSYSGISLTIDDFYLGGIIDNTIIQSSGCSNVSLVFYPKSAQTYNRTFSITTEYCTHYFEIQGVGVNNIISANTQNLDFGNVCFGDKNTQYLTIKNLTPDDRAISIQTTPSEFYTPNTLMLGGNSSVNVPYTFTPSYPLTNPVIWSKQFTGSTKITNCPTLEVSLSGTGFGGNLYVSSLDFGCVNKNCYKDLVATIYNDHCLPVNISGVTIPDYYQNSLHVLGFIPTTIPAGGTSTLNIRYSAITSLNTYMDVATDYALSKHIVSGITACMVDTISSFGAIQSITTTPGIPKSTNVTITNKTSTNLFIGASIKNITGGSVSNITVTPPLLTLPAPTYPVTAITNTLTITFNDANSVTDWFNLYLTDNCGNHSITPFYVSSTKIGHTNDIIKYPSCNGNNNGSITITPTGGTLPYAVIWSNGVTGNSISNLTADTYNVQITDSHLNSDIFTFNITQPNPLTVNHNVPFNGYVNVLTYSANTGYIYTNVNGGTLPYTYYWSGFTYQGLNYNSVLSDISGLTAGDYQLTITDANFCQITDFIKLTQPDPLYINITNCTPPVPPTTSCTLTGGTADIVVSGGQGPYVIVVCPTTPQNPLFAPGGPYYGLTTCQPLVPCGLNLSGTPCVTYTNYCCDGTPEPCTSGCPITSTQLTISGLTTGNYPPGSFGVDDTNSGSTKYIVPTFVPNPSTLGFTLSQTSTTCPEISNGSITVTIIPTMNQLGVYGMGVPPYTYFLDNIQQSSSTTAITETYFGLSSDNHTIKVMDSDHNVVSETIYVGRSRVSASISTVSETLQQGDGSIKIDTIFGGIEPFTARINSSTPIVISDGYTFNNLSAGNYLIEITDSLGCTFVTKPMVTRVIPTESGKKQLKQKPAISNPTIYEKRLGGFKIISKK